MVYSIVSVLLFACLSVQASICSLYLDQPQSLNWTSEYKKSILRLNELDQDLYQEIISSPQPSLIKTYIALKQKAWSILPFGMVNWRSKTRISDLQFERWKYFFGTRYNFDSMNENQKIIFYSNALQSVYASLALQIKYEYISSFLAFDNQSEFFSENSEFKSNLFRMLNYLFDKFVVYDLRRSELNPDLLENIFTDLESSKAAWIKFVLIFRDISKYKPSYSQLETWDSFKNLSTHEKDMVRAAYSNYQNKVESRLCFKNDGGCLFCPNNLGFILKSN